MTTPVIRRLQEAFPELPLLQAEHDFLDWTFTENIQKLGPDFYRKIIPYHLVLNLEYSLLGQQLRAKFLSDQLLNQNEIIEQLIAALMLAELLEHVYQYYLIVPREVTRLRQHQKIYHELLVELIQSLSAHEIKLTENDSSFSQRVRNITAHVNLYRHLFIRSKRALDLIATLGTESKTYGNFIKAFDKYTDPILIYLAWIFYLPRLSVNCFLLIKHTIPGSWMGEEEKSLGWFVRLNAQMQRRWFELANDLAWVTVGMINCFLLTGVLAPVGIYLSLACFGYDVIISITRACIELNRLRALQEHYLSMKTQEQNPEDQKQIQEHLKAINRQIHFEILRLGSHVTTTAVIFLAMCCTTPLFLMNPIIPLIGAACLVTISFINFALAQIIENNRPQDTIKFSSSAAKLGFFAKAERAKTDLHPENKEPVVLACC